MGETGEDPTEATVCMRVPHGERKGRRVQGMGTVASTTNAIPDVGATTTQVILAEIGLGMSWFPIPDHLASGATLRPRTINSGAKNTTAPGQPGQPLAEGHPGRSGNRHGPHGRLPQRPLPTPRQTARPCKDTGHRRPINPSHSLTPHQRPRPASRTSARTGTNTPRKPAASFRQLQLLGHQVTLVPTARAFVRFRSAARTLPPAQQRFDFRSAPEPS